MVVAGAELLGGGMNASRGIAWVLMLAAALVVILARV